MPVALREMSLYELDQGYYSWRTETATTTSQTPEHWAPVGINYVAIYPRVGTDTGLAMEVYLDSPLLEDSTDYIDVDEGHLQKILEMAQSILAFKQGLVEGTDNAKAMRELFLTAAREKNQELTKLALYKNYMGASEDQGEPGKPAPQMGVRG